MSKKHYNWKRGRLPPEIGPHSLAKHRILARYIRRYLEILTATPTQEQLSITFVDGYAGGGKYRSAQKEFPGSPLIILSAVAEVEAKLNSERSKGFRINAEYVFVDEQKNHTEFLRSELESSPFRQGLDRYIRIWTGDFNERISEAIEIAKKRSPRSGRAIFLLDQYGWSQVAFKSIRTIFAELQNAEVFLTFSVDSLIDYLSLHNLDMRAFGEIDIDPAIVRELVRIKEEEQVGYRALIQNGLYQHIQASTTASFYSPFFIKSPEAHRSYWFIHLSNHREARNEIGMIHWSENNTTVHHGGAGLHALGFASGRSLEQLAISYLFDDHANALSRSVLHEQLPRLIYDTATLHAAVSLEELFGLRCNDTPVVREILESVLLDLRNQREILIADSLGREKPRANKVEWTDRISLPPQRSFFSRFPGDQKK